MAGDLDRGRKWVDNHGRTWEWSDTNGWCVDGMATYAGYWPTDGTTLTFTPADGRGRFYPPLAIGEEKHIHTDEEMACLVDRTMSQLPGWQIMATDGGAALERLRAMTARTYANLTEIGAVADEPDPTTADVHDAILAEAKRQHEADFAKREAFAREALTARLRERITAHLEGHRGIDRTMADHVYSSAADAALEVFMEFLRDPPTMEHHADGHTEVRWPGDD